MVAEAKGTHILISSEREKHLLRITKGVISMIDSLKVDNTVDLDFELESLYGIAFIAMQNYINATASDCFIIGHYDDDPKNELSKYAKELRKAGRKIDNSPYSNVDLIYTLANSAKHRYDNMEPLSYAIIKGAKYSPSTFLKSYIGYTREVLSHFDLLSPIDDNTGEWEIYPILKGLKYLGGNLSEIASALCSWGEDMKNKASHLMD